MRDYQSENVRKLVFTEISFLYGKKLPRILDKTYYFHNLKNALRSLAMAGFYLCIDEGHQIWYGMKDYQRENVRKFVFLRDFIFIRWKITKNTR